MTPNFGETLRRYRRQAGMSGDELARRVNRSQSWISRVERGRATATPPEVERLAAALDCTPDQTEELMKLAAEPPAMLSARERAAVVQRIKTLLDMVAEEAARLR